MATSLSTDLLTSQEVADILRVDPRTLYDYHRKGILPGFKLYSGKRNAPLRWRRIDVDDYLEKRVEDKENGRLAKEPSRPG